MAFGLGAGTMGGLAGAAGQAAGAGQGGPNGGQGGGKGGGGKSLRPIPPKKPKDLIPDSDGGALPQEPQDLSILAGPQDLPERRPLQSPSVSVPSVGVTGYAGGI